MKSLKYLLMEVVEALRQMIMCVDKEIGEEVKWYTAFFWGEIPPFDPKEYKRHIIVFNFFKKIFIQPVFPQIDNSKLQIIK